MRMIRIFGYLLPKDVGEEIRKDDGYLKRIIYFDECKFSLSGRVKGKNYRVWGTRRSTHRHAVQHQGPSVMVWYAVTEKEIFGLNFFENRTVN